MVISIGYRVNSDRAVQFRKMGYLYFKRIFKKGYIIDKKRMANEHFLMKIIMIHCLLNKGNKVIRKKILSKNH